MKRRITATTHARRPLFAAGILLARGSSMRDNGSVAWYVYLARCADDTLYCGITNDVAARTEAHNAGKGAKYTRTRRPIEVLLVRACRTKGRALSLEYRVKQLTRRAKERLVAAPVLFDRLVARRTA
jgi:putative endonuclease